MISEPMCTTDRVELALQTTLSVLDAVWTLERVHNVRHRRGVAVMYADVGAASEAPKTFVVNGTQWTHWSWFNHGIVFYVTARTSPPSAAVMKHAHAQAKRGAAVDARCSWRPKSWW